MSESLGSPEYVLGSSEVQAIEPYDEAQIQADLDANDAPHAPIPEDKVLDFLDAVDLSDMDTADAAYLVDTGIIEPVDGVEFDR